MPIVFAQPQPVDSAASYGSGRAGVMTQNNSVIAGLYKAIADAYAQSNQNATQVQIQSLRNQQSGAELAYGTQNQNYRHMASLAQQDAEAGTQADAHIQSAQIHAQAEIAKQTQEFTQSDKIRLQKYQAGRSWVDSQREQGSITDDQATEMYSMIAAGESPLKVREANSKEQYYKLKQDELTRQTQARASASNDFDKILAGDMPGKVATLYDPGMQGDVTAELMQDPAFRAMHPSMQKEVIQKEVRDRGGVLGHYTLDANGKIQKLDTDKPPKPAGEGPAKLPAGALTQHQFSVLLGHANKNAEDTIAKNIKDNSDNQGYWDSEDGIRRRQVVGGEMKKLGFATIGNGEPPTYQDYLKQIGYNPNPPKARPSYGRQPGQGGQPGNSPVAPPQQTQAAPAPGQPQAQPVQPKQYASPKQWQEDIPGIKAQQDYDQSKALISSAVPEKQRESAQKDLDRSYEIVRNNMGVPQSGPDAKEYQEIKSRLQPLLQQTEAQTVAAQTKTRDIAQSLLDQRVSWEQAEKAMKAQGIDPTPYREAYQAGLQYQNDLEEHHKRQATKYYNPSQISPRR